MLTQQTELVLHPEACSGAGSGMRWVLPGVLLPTGRLMSAPGALGDLLASGVIEAATCEPHALLIHLAPGLGWREYGPSVRTAIGEAVADLLAWRCDGDRDAVLRMIVDDVLAGHVGDYIRSHGGNIEVVEVADDCVTVGFAGACAHCPVSGQTLNQRLAAAVRERYPDLRAVTELKHPTHRRAQVWLWPRRRQD